MAVQYCCDHCNVPVDSEYQEGEGWELPAGWFQLIRQGEDEAPKHFCRVSCLQGYTVDRLAVEGA
jgi:hypothetical protein